MPLLRYRTGDIAALDRSSCVCGRTLARMSKVTGRKTTCWSSRASTSTRARSRRCWSPSGPSPPTTCWSSTAPRPCRGWWWPASLAAGWTICAETEEAERDRVAAEVAARCWSGSA